MPRWARGLIGVPVALALAGLAGCSAGGSDGGNATIGGIDATSEAASISAPAAITPASTAAPTSADTTPGVSAAGSGAASSGTAPAFVSLNVTTDRDCDPQAGVTTVQAILRWQVSNATGIAVNINNGSPYGATQFAMMSGATTITTVSCTGSSYTFDVWTVGGTGSQPAHRRLTYSPGN